MVLSSPILDADAIILDCEDAIAIGIEGQCIAFDQAYAFAIAKTSETILGPDQSARK
jgi:citrate lyase beta subunit